MKLPVCRSFLILASIIALVGCETLPQRGTVQQEWSKNLRELGIVPVFPPREDVHVGDIYVSSFNPDGADADRIMETKWSELTPEDQAIRREMGMWTRWHSLDVSTIAHDEYYRRPALPATATPHNLSDALEKGMEQPTRGDKSLFLQDRAAPDWGRVNRGRLVAFPDFSATAYNQADLKALIPIETFSFGLNGDYRNLKSATVKIPVAESYSVPVQAILEQLAPVISDRLSTDSQIAEQITSATVMEYHRQLLNPTNDMIPHKLDVELIPLLVDACRRALTNFQWTSTNDPALAHKSGSISPMLGWGYRLTEIVRRGSRPGDITDAEWLRLIKRFDGALEPTFVYRRRLGRAVGKSPVVLRNADLSRFRFFTRQGHQPPEAYLRVITEVFYARAMDISVVSERSTGVRASVASPLPAPVHSPNPPGTASSATEPTTPKQPINTRIEAISDRLKTVQPIPGGSTEFISATDHMVGIRRVFERPVAIGVRAITLTVDVNTGFVVSASASAGETPLAR